MPRRAPRPARRRWAFLSEEDFDRSGERRVRVLIVMRIGIPGHIVRFTDACTGCFERGESGGPVYCGGYDASGNPVGAGCDECGYTGKRRHQYWVPLPNYAEDFERAWTRRERRQAARREVVHAA